MRKSFFLCLWPVSLIKISISTLSFTDHSEGSTDEIVLYGAPNIQIKEEFPEYDTFRSALTANHPDLIFLQVNPGPYLARQRFLAHKCALKGVEDYEINVSLKTFINPFNLTLH